MYSHRLAFHLHVEKDPRTQCTYSLKVVPSDCVQVYSSSWNVPEGIDDWLLVHVLADWLFPVMVGACVPNHFSIYHQYAHF